MKIQIALLSYLAISSFPTAMGNEIEIENEVPAAEDERAREKPAYVYGYYDMLRAIERDDRDLVTEIAAAYSGMYMNYVEQPLDMEENRSLHVAAECGNAPMIDLLMAYGARTLLTVRNRSGRTPLSMGSRSEPVVRKLVEEYQADVHECEPGTEGTLLHSLHTVPNAEVVEYLIKKGVPVDKLDKNGESPFITASRYEVPDVLNIFLQNDVDADEADTRTGNTALHWSAAYGCMGNVKALLQAGADWKRTNKKGQTALTLAKCTGVNEDIVAILERWEKEKDTEKEGGGGETNFSGESSSRPVPPHPPTKASREAGGDEANFSRASGRPIPHPPKAVVEAGGGGTNFSGVLPPIPPPIKIGEKAKGVGKKFSGVRTKRATTRRYRLPTIMEEAEEGIGEM